MIYVTHDQIEAMKLADRIAVFSAGRIEQIGAPLELYHYPKKSFRAGFLGSPNAHQHCRSELNCCGDRASSNWFPPLGETVP